MISNAFNWIKTHKLVTFLLLVVAFLLLKNNLHNNPRMMKFHYGEASSVAPMAGAPANMDMDFKVAGKVSDVMMNSYAPVPPSVAEQRMVIQNSYLSLLVDNVEEIQAKIIQKAQEIGGHMVNTSLQNPEGNATSHITVSVPSSKLDEVLKFYRGLSVRVVSENLQGEDVTAQYEDLDARLKTLQMTKEKFQAIFDRATQVDDILNVQQQLINVQSQIDSIVGQKAYLEKSSELASITIYLSTDELALPYAPDDAWRPELILKEAIRSLIGTFREVAAAVIWLIVYAVVWVPILGIIYLLYKKNLRKV